LRQLFNNKLLHPVLAVGINLPPEIINGCKLKFGLAVVAEEKVTYLQTVLLAAAVAHITLLLFRFHI
jgi:hypothetical protein